MNKILNKKERNKLKNEMVKALSIKDVGLFDRTTGEPRVFVTLDMIEECIFNGLNVMTDKNAK